MMLLPFLNIFAILIQKASSNDNGLAQTPPMGWRSWNQYYGDVDQSLMQQIMEGMVDRGRADHANQPTSLCDLGYCDVGLDDNWQACGSPEAAPGMNYHDINGNPIVNLKRFPNLRQMTDFAHSLNLTRSYCSIARQRQLHSRWSSRVYQECPVIPAKLETFGSIKMRVNSFIRGRPLSKAEVPPFL